MIKDLFRRLLSSVPRSVPVSTEQLDHCLDLLAPLARLIPEFTLTPKQRRGLSAARFREAPLLIGQVAWALERFPDLFVDVPVQPEDLLGCAHRAYAYRALRDCLLMLAERADDHLRVAQAEAVDTAFGVLRQVRDDVRRPYPGPRADERRAALAPAEVTLRAWLRRRQGR